MEPNQRHHTRKLSLALVGAFLSIYLLSANLGHRVLSADTIFYLLTDLSLSISQTGATAAFAATQVLTLLLGVFLLSANFFTFASLARRFWVVLIGGVGIGVTALTMIGPDAAVFILLFLLLPALLLQMYNPICDYGTMLTLGTLLNVVLYVVSLGRSTLRLGGEATAEGLRRAILAASTELAEVYREITAVMLAGSEQRFPSLLFTLKPDQAVAMVVNYLPTVLVVAAMLMAFFSTTYFRRTDGRQVPRLGAVILQFDISRVGAAVYVLASVMAFVLPSPSGDAATQLMAIMTLPLALRGLGTINRNARVAGRLIPFMAMLALMWFSGVYAMLMFLAVCGAVDVLLPDKLRQRLAPPPRADGRGGPRPHDGGPGGDADPAAGEVSRREAGGDAEATHGETGDDAALDEPTHESTHESTHEPAHDAGAEGQDQADPPDRPDAPPVD
ncbi:MAG: hypothetical protein GXX99_02760 [Clostridiales bacterium]|nr:hypothetical protein [Clostridiales bacterium]